MKTGEGNTVNKKNEQSTMEDRTAIATSKTNQQIKEKLQKISKLLIEKNAVAYRKLANQ